MNDYRVRVILERKSLVTGEFRSMNKGSVYITDDVKDALQVLDEASAAITKRHHELIKDLKV